jgi:hypothetical protein
VRIGNGVRRKTAVPRVAGEKRAVTEIFHALLAEAANAAGISEPGDSDPVTDAVGRDMAADEVDTAYDFMAWNNRIFDAGKLGVDDMKVGPANPACVHLDADFSLGGDGVRALLHLERLTGGRQHHRTHLFLR